MLFSQCYATFLCLFDDQDNDLHLQHRSLISNRFYIFYDCEMEIFHIKVSDFFSLWWGGRGEAVQNLGCWYLSEPPHRGVSNVFPQLMLKSNNYKQEKI